MRRVHARKYPGDPLDETTLTAMVVLAELLTITGTDHVEAASLFTEVISAYESAGRNSLSAQLPRLGQLQQFATMAAADPWVAAQLQQAKEENGAKVTRTLQQRSARRSGQAVPEVIARVLSGNVAQLALHGKEVNVLQYLEGTDKYIVCLPGQGELGETVHLNPTDIVLGEGTVVFLAGMQGAPELNGRAGLIQGFDAAKGRYTVNVDGEPRLKNPKPVNCRPEFDAESSTDDEDL